MDEVPTINLPDLAKYPAEFRSKGCVTILGLQNIAQLAHAYGDKKADIIMVNMANKFMFNPQHEDTAKKISSYVGDTEIIFKTANEGQSFNQGGNGRSKGKSETIQVKPLIRSEEILRMKRDCILISPGLQTATEGSIPWHIKQIKIPLKQGKRYVSNRQLWREKLEAKLIQRAKKRLGIAQFAELDARMETALNARIELAEELLPMPVKAEKSEPSLPF
jgi:type IV secretory pathway TraG/TraD family ATPase VirD4